MSDTYNARAIVHATMLSDFGWGCSSRTNAHCAPCDIVTAAIQAAYTAGLSAGDKDPRTHREPTPEPAPGDDEALIRKMWCAFLKGTPTLGDPLLPMRDVLAVVREHDGRGGGRT